MKAYAVVGPDGELERDQSGFFIHEDEGMAKSSCISLDPAVELTVVPVNIATECRWERSDLFGGGDEYRTGCATDTTRFALPEFCPDCGGPVVVIEGAG